MELTHLRYLQPPAPVAQERGDLPLSSPNTQPRLWHSSAQANTTPKSILLPHQAQQLPRGGIQDVFGMDPNFEDFASNAMMHKGKVKNRPMGQWDIRKNSLLQMEWKVWRCWGTIPSNTLQKHQEGPGQSLQRDIAWPVPPIPHPCLSRAGYTKGQDSQN